MGDWPQVRSLDLRRHTNSCYVLFHLRLELVSGRLDLLLVGFSSADCSLRFLAGQDERRQTVVLGLDQLVLQLLYMVPCKPANRHSNHCSRCYDFESWPGQHSVSYICRRLILAWLACFVRLQGSPAALPRSGCLLPWRFGFRQLLDTCYIRRESQVAAGNDHSRHLACLVRHELLYSSELFVHEGWNHNSFEWRYARQNACVKS